MNRPLFERGLWAVALGLTVLAGWLAGAHATSSQPSPAPSSDGTRPLAVGRDSTTLWARRLVSADPFRLDRRPAEVRFGAPLPSAAPAVPVERPVLTLLGTIGGPPWQAVVSGLAGRGGSAVARPGDRYGELVVRRVATDSAVIEGPDTVWVLVAPRPRQ